jgi:leucyl aminopeptidase
MKKIYLKFIEKSDNTEKFILKTDIDNVYIIINVFNLSHYELNKELDKMYDIIKIYNKIINIYIDFDKKFEEYEVNKIITKLNDVLYNYYPNTKKIKLLNVTEDSKNMMEELIKYKDIVMDPNKNPSTYLSYITSRIPKNYNYKVYEINKLDTKYFPLTRAVGSASTFDNYFVHIYPNQYKPNKKNIFLVGKAVTFDSGGLNLKLQGMENMKNDMTGSAIILSVLQLLNLNQIDKELNIHLLIPIVENMIGPKGVRPGMVIKSMKNKKIEIINTDAEGRLCLVDAFDFVHINLLDKLNPADCLLLDIATLTGNTLQITSGISSIGMCNDKGQNYLDDIVNIGEDIGEYVDYLKIRPEYLDMLKSNVADIKNIDMSIKSGCVLAGTFLNHFVDKNIPWVHLDVGVTTFSDYGPNSYGINLLYQFIKKLIHNA